MARIFNPVLIALVAIAINVHGFPLEKRIAQTISDSTTKWEAACDAAGGGSQCNTIAVNAFGNLLAAADPCGQQNAADQMIDLAKQLNSNAAMISAAQIFAQQPRNTPTSQAVPYCQSAPKNAELDGLFQCQFAGANENTFVGGLAVGSAGTIPFGLTSAVSPAGSCPAHPDGPVPDGEQLSDLVSSPGTPSSGSGSSGSASASASDVASTTAAATSAAATSAAAPTQSSGATDSGSCVIATETASDASATATATAVSSTASATATGTNSSSSSSFLQSNGEQAQQQNAQFATLSASSSCTEGSVACVGGEFAQCVNGAFTLQSCASTLSCFALPLVNKAGTSVTCTTEADAAARIAATGVSGGVTGSGSTGSSSSASDVSTSDAATPTANTAVAIAPAASSSASSSSSSSLRLSNGQKAQQQNAQFAALTAEDSCTEGSEACVGADFAQCVAGKWVTQSCGSTLQCFALPLVNSAGTSITCTTQSDAAARIANTGATGGVTGSGN
ncbi:hypothetical protein FOMPIDRAFT_1023366 [Fomitopsis schrenkii]|uniref:Carbohydrate-binding module family 19 domain-containing protein n=1 Tax=Fomitopsis schrenkii TaxID=2126942 RepID=S8FIN0_FOMSC|nr:hypothetical protein FOMPIDRAFT_1023366 [Fomitopsis schrenkii]